MEETLELEFSRATRGPHSIGIMMDIDHFKRLNDSWGHEAGDEVLRRWPICSGRACVKGTSPLATAAKSSFSSSRRRRSPWRAPGGEDLREQVKRLLVPYRDQLVGPVSVSVGVAAFPDHGKTAPILLRAVDAALYRAKAEGRDRVEVAE
jgi:GGDEF domain-containing protein